MAKLLVFATKSLFLQQLLNKFRKIDMAHFGQSDDYRRDELIRIIEHSVEKLTLAELEALYYDMTTKSYINES